jgi:hypothetical protein
MFYCFNGRNTVQHTHVQYITVAVSLGTSEEFKGFIFWDIMMCILTDAGFEVLTALVMNTTQYSLLKINRRFGGIWYLRNSVLMSGTRNKWQ